ncbi:MAG: hypothetical protein AAGU77_10885 [Bacillota bacterium]
MKRLKFNQIIVIVLLALSVIFFFVQYLIFHNLEEEAFLVFQDLTFLPVEILLVTFILDRILHSREKQERMQQVRIVMSAFFSEMGTDVLSGIGEMIPDKAELKDKLDMKAGWNAKDFAAVSDALKHIKLYAIPDAKRLAALRDSLSPGKGYLLQMFSNPNLLEHDTFTDMLWALYHLIDELENREDFSALPESDLRHIGGDITRAYGLLTFEWVQHMRYLKERYPYLWSIAVRKNPFGNSGIIVRE